MKFQAALKGVDLDEDEERETAEEVFARTQRRAAARIAGLSDEEIDASAEVDEFADFGMEVEIID